VVLESPDNREDHADGNAESRGNDTSREAVGTYSNAICLTGDLHGVAQVVMHSQVVSQLTGVANVQNADMAMH
jgi:hypothetical protein